MDNLKPCGCGATPETLLIRDGSTFRWRYISGSCCGEWEHECRVPTLGDNATPEGVKAACIKAWNDLPRPSQLAAHAEVVEAAREVINTSMVVGDTSVVNTKELMSLAAALAKLEEAGK